MFFGRIGDLVGRKYAFLVTLVIMGGATFIIGLLPTYAQIGVLAPVILVLLRLLQGWQYCGQFYTLFWLQNSNQEVARPAD